MKKTENEKERALVARLLSLTRYNNIKWNRSDKCFDAYIRSYATKIDNQIVEIIEYKCIGMFSFGLFCGYDLVIRSSASPQATVCESKKLLSPLFVEVRKNARRDYDSRKNQHIDAVLKSSLNESSAHRMSFDPVFGTAQKSDDSNS